MKEIKNNKDNKPMSYYRELYAKLDPVSVSNRCLVPYSAESGQFAIDFMGNGYTVSFPDFEIRLTRQAVELPCEIWGAMNILVIRYLLYGAGTEPSDSYITYREVPWGETYFKAFDQRCIKELARVFGNDIELFKRTARYLGCTPISLGDAAFEYKFMGSLTLRFILWAADEEFPAAAQFLFNSSFNGAFNAEDMAGIGDICISAFKYAAEKLS
jgi:hypothetical protein